MKTVELVSGYDRSKKPTKQTFRVVTLEDVKAWAVPQQEKCKCNSGYFDVEVANSDHADSIKRILGIDCVPGQIVTMPCTCLREGHAGIRYIDTTPSHVWFIAVDGTARQAKVNGKVRTWKRDTNRVELPLKYGMYEYTVFTTTDIKVGRLLMPVAG